MDGVVLDDPTDLPESVEVALEVVDDVLDAELHNERAALEASIDACAMTPADAGS